jgi:hypothetical protein
MPAEHADSAPNEPRALHVVPRFAILAAAVLTVLAAAASLWWPFGWDQGIFAWIGGTAARGGLPYRDAWDVKGPLTFAPFALTELVFGREMWAIRLFDLALLALAVAAIRRLVRSRAGPGAATGAALLYALAYLGFGYWHTAQPDGWVAMIALVGWAPMLADERAIGRPGVMAAAGIVVGLGVLAKPLYLLLALVPLGALALAGEIPPARRVRLALAFAGGAAAPVLICAAAFAIRGGLGALLDTYLGFNAELARTGQKPVVRVLRGMYGRMVERPAVLLALPAAAAGVAVLARDARRTAIVLGGWLLLALLIVFIQGRLFGYHWHAVFAPLAVLTGIGLGRLWRPNGGAPALEIRSAVALLTLLLASLIARQPAREVYSWLRHVTGEATRTEYLADYAYPGLGYSPADDRAAAAWLAGRTASGDRVLAWSDPAVNWLARRDPPGRLAFHIPVNSFDGTPLTARQLAYREELLADLGRGGPRYILIADRALQHEPDYQLSIPGQFPALAALLAAEYEETARIGGWHVFARRDSAGTD